VPYLHPRFPSTLADLYYVGQLCPLTNRSGRAAELPDQRWRIMFLVYAIGRISFDYGHFVLAGCDRDDPVVAIAEYFHRIWINARCVVKAVARRSDKLFIATPYQCRATR
jgi:hypothetical protein